MKILGLTIEAGRDGRSDNIKESSCGRWKTDNDCKLGKVVEEENLQVY